MAFANAVISPARPIPNHGQSSFTMTCSSPVAMASTFVWMLNVSQEVCVDCTMTMMSPDIPSMIILLLKLIVCYINTAFVNSMSFRSKILATAAQVASLNLAISQVTASQHGGSVYDCVAINSQGSFGTSVMLLVAPAFTQQPVSQGDLEVGDNVTLSCIAESHPLPVYQWEQFNETSQSFIELTGETSTTLQLTNLSVSNFGEYRCKAIVSEINVTIVSNISNISSESILLNIEQYHKIFTLDASLQLSSSSLSMTKSVTISNTQLSSTTISLTSSPSTFTPRQAPDLALIIGVPVLTLRVLAIILLAVGITIGLIV